MLFRSLPEYDDRLTAVRRSRVGPLQFVAGQREIGEFLIRSDHIRIGTGLDVPCQTRAIDGIGAEKAETAQGRRLYSSAVPSFRFPEVYFGTSDRVITWTNRPPASNVTIPRGSGPSGSPLIETASRLPPGLSPIGPERCPSQSRIPLPRLSKAKAGCADSSYPPGLVDLPRISVPTRVIVGFSAVHRNKVPTRDGENRLVIVVATSRGSVPRRKTTC